MTRPLVVIRDEQWADFARTATHLDSAKPFAGVLNLNPLLPEPWHLTPEAAAALPGQRVIAWSGTRSEEGLFTRDAQTWLPDGLRSLHAWCDALAPTLEASDATLLLRPHARHVLCDAHRCRSFLADRAGQPIGLALSVAALFEADMIEDAEDHCRRAFETLAPLASCYIHENIAAPADTDDFDACLERVPAPAGILPEEGLAEMIAQHLPPETPVLLWGTPTQVQESADRLAAARA